MRVAGDLVARMQMTRGMKIDAAKAHVAEKLGVSVPDLTDPVVMYEVRSELGIEIAFPQQDLHIKEWPGMVDREPENG